MNKQSNERLGACCKNIQTSFQMSLKIFGGANQAQEGAALPVSSDQFYKLFDLPKPALDGHSMLHVDALKMNYVLNSANAVMAPLANVPLESLQSINVKDTALDKNTRSMLIKCLQTLV